MTFQIKEKYSEGSLTRFVVEDETTCVYLTYSTPITDQEIIDMLEEQKAINKAIVEEEKRIQKEIEENVNG